MNTLTQTQADNYARWFRCLADATRLRILNFIAHADSAVRVGDIVESMDRSQSTVSRHLQVLADEQFILTEPDGVRTLVRINPSCMTELPEAAARIMAVSRAAEK